jgi:uncharacterized protein (DUF58 family)
MAGARRAMNPSSTLLAPELLQKLERMQVRNRRSLVGQMQGAHRSPLRGTSLDFADYRPYAPGDDIRRIDEHVYARLDVLALKLFDSEDDLTIRLVIDTSASMGFGAKIRCAAQLAAALGFVGLVHRDTVRVHTLDQLIVRKTQSASSNSPARRFVGRGNTNEMFRVLEELVAAGGTPLAAGLRRLLTMPGPPGLTVVFSDLLTDEWDQALRKLPPGNGAAFIVHVLSDEELAPTLVGDYELRDVETRRDVLVSLDDQRLARYRSDVARWCDQVEQRCRAGGLGYVRATTSQPVEQLVRAILFGVRVAS